MKNRKLRYSVVFLLLATGFLIGIFSSMNNKDYDNISIPTQLPLTSNLKSFISVWDTTKSGVSSSNQVHLPLESSGNYIFTINWGDGNNDTITIWNQSSVTHTYTSPGVYIITILGEIIGWQFNYQGDRLKILEIQQFGCLQLGNLGSYFYGCTNLVLTATDSLNLNGTTNLFRAFKDCHNLGNSGNLNSWNTSNITNMSEMFSDAMSFNQPLNNWNVSNVKTMYFMFSQAHSFNKAIDNWDVSSVTDMRGMFSTAYSFNQPLNNWNVANVVDMSSMFYQAESFNQPIGDWNLSKLELINGMFARASSFNQPLEKWDLSKVTSMSGMFVEALSFNNNIGSWNVSNVVNMASMFEGASSFNQPLGNWNLSRVVNMNHMFFQASLFNQSLDNWDVSSVTDMSYMFHDAFSFNQPLGNWNVSSVTNMNSMFNSVTLSIKNYDNLLVGWSKLLLQIGMTLDVGNSKYSNTGKDSRQFIIDNFDWIIIDDGLISPGEFNLSSDADTPDTDGIFTLEWTPAIRANNYSVYLYSGYITEINSSVILLTAEITELTYIMSMYMEGTYYLIVVAYNDYDDTLSNCIVINVKLPPARITLSSNAGTPDTDGEFTLDWTMALRADNYSVYSHSSSITKIDGSLTLLANETIGLSLELTGYTHGTYYFIVVAHNQYGNNLSNCLGVVVDLSPDLFTLISNAGTPDTDGDFILHWTASMRASNYTVYSYSSYILEINGSLTLLMSETIDLSLELTEISHGTHYFIVVAYNQYGNNTSNCLTVMIDFSPGAFTLTSDAGTPDTDGKFTLNWNESMRATNYTLYSHSSYITQINGSLTPLIIERVYFSLQLTGYDEGIYYFIVVAHNQYGDTISNCIYIRIVNEIATPVIPGYSIFLLIGIFGIISIIMIRKRIEY